MTKKLNFQQRWENSIDRLEKLANEPETHQTTEDNYVPVENFSDNYYCELEVY